MRFPEPHDFLRRNQRPDRCPAAGPWHLTSESLSFENGHDFVCSRINDHNFIAYEDVVITTPLGIDRDNFIGSV